MTTFALLHGGGHTAAAWDLVIPELHKLGHQTLTVDLPVDDSDARLADYIDVAAYAFADAGPVTVVAHSILTAAGLGLEKRVLVEGIITPAKMPMIRTTVLDVGPFQLTCVMVAPPQEFLSPYRASHRGTDRVALRTLCI